MITSRSSPVTRLNTKKSITRKAALASRRTLLALLEVVDASAAEDSETDTEAVSDVVADVVAGVVGVDGVGWLAIGGNYNTGRITNPTPAFLEHSVPSPFEEG